MVRIRVKKQGKIMDILVVDKDCPHKSCFRPCIHIPGDTEIDIGSKDKWVCLTYHRNWCPENNKWSSINDKGYLEQNFPNMLKEVNKGIIYKYNNKGNKIELTDRDRLVIESIEGNRAGPRAKVIAIIDHTVQIFCSTMHHIYYVYLAEGYTPYINESGYWEFCAKIITQNGYTIESEGSIALVEKNEKVLKM